MENKHGIILDLGILIVVEVFLIAPISVVFHQVKLSSVYDQNKYMKQTRDHNWW